MMENSNSELPSEAIINNRIEKIRRLCNLMEPFGFSGTLLIAQNGSVLLDEGYGHRDYENALKMKSNTIMSIGSVAKQITATLILQLRDKALLSLDDTIGKYLDNLPEAILNLTIHQLLNHTSGLPGALGFDFEGIHQDEFLALLSGVELAFEPGTEFLYSNVAYSVAAIIAEKIVSKPFIVQLQDLFNKLDMSSASSFGDSRYNSDNSAVYYVDGKRQGSVYEWQGNYDSEHPRWHLLGNGGICLHHQDLYTYTQALFRGDLISDQSLEKMLTPGINDYGYGWDILETPLGIMIRHDGGSGGGVGHATRYYRDLDLTLMISSNSIINGRQTGFIVEDIIQLLLDGETIQLPPKIDQLSLTNNRISTGTYNVERLESVINVTSIPYGPLLLKIDDQSLVNKILDLPDLQKEQYARMNDMIHQFGTFMINREWDKAFQFAKRKTEYENRVNTLEKLMSSFEDNNGKLSHVKSGGTIPSEDFLAETLLQLVSVDGKIAGIPIVWENENEFLGFYPILKDHILIYTAVQVNNEIIAYSPEKHHTIIFHYDPSTGNFSI